MKIMVQGVEETNLKLSQILAAVQENVDNTLDLFSGDMTKEIKDSAPYDTGRYMSSWFYERKESMKYAIISQNSYVPYNTVLVFGTEKFKPIANESRYKYSCLLYTSPSPRDKRESRMPSSA